MNISVATIVMVVTSFIILNNPEKLLIPQGKSTVCDGKIAMDEWKGASVIMLRKNEFADVKILFRHDRNKLLLAYVYEKQRDSTYFLPEIFIDTKPDNSNKWEPDDLWFHVSAQDCFSAGKREDYSGCSVEGKGWNAVPNYPFGNNFRKIEAVEIEIPFELIDIGQGQEFGICFSLAIFPGDKRISYPDTADADIPATWIKAELR